MVNVIETPMFLLLQLHVSRSRLRGSRCNLNHIWGWIPKGIGFGGRKERVLEKMGSSGSKATSSSSSSSSSGRRSTSIGCRVFRSSCLGIKSRSYDGENGDQVALSCFNSHSYSSSIVPFIYSSSMDFDQWNFPVLIGIGSTTLIWFSFVCIGSHY